MSVDERLALLEAARRAAADLADHVICESERRALAQLQRRAALAEGCELLRPQAGPVR